MPNVPFITNDRNLANIPNLDNRAPGPDAFGAGFGQGLQSLAGDMNQYAQRLKVKEDRLAIENATTRYDQWLGDFTVGKMDQNGTLLPGTGYLSRKGAEVRGASVKLLMDEEQVYRDIASGLSDDQRMEFDQRRAVRLQNTRDRLAGHEAMEMKNDRIGSGIATAQARMMSAISDPDNGDKFKGQTVEGIGALIGALQEDGKTPEEIGLKVAEYKSNAWASRIDAILKRGKLRSDAGAANADFLQAERMIEDKDTFLVPEQKERMLLEAKDARAYFDRLAEHNAALAAKAEDSNLAKAYMNVDWTNPQSRAAFLDRARTSPVPSVADNYFQRAKAMQESIENEANKNANDAANKETFRFLENGVYYGKNGEILHLSESQWRSKIDDFFIKGATIAERDKLNEIVKQHSDKRVQDFVSRVFSEVLPDEAKYFVSKDGAIQLDDFGQPIIAKQGSGKPQFSPSTEAFKRQAYSGAMAVQDGFYTTRYKNLAEVPDRLKKYAKPDVIAESVSLANIQQASRAMKDMLLNDKNMTVPEAVKQFKEMVKPDMKRISMLRISDAIAAKYNEAKTLEENFKARMLNKTLKK